MTNIERGAAIGTLLYFTVMSREHEAGWYKLRKVGADMWLCWGRHDDESNRGAPWRDYEVRRAIADGSWRIDEVIPGPVPQRPTMLLSLVRKYKLETFLRKGGEELWVTNGWKTMIFKDTDFDEEVIGRVEKFFGET